MVMQIDRRLIAIEREFIIHIYSVGFKKGVGGSKL